MVEQNKKGKKSQYKLEKETRRKLWACASQTPTVRQTHGTRSQAAGQSVTLLKTKAHKNHGPPAGGAKRNREKEEDEEAPPSLWQEKNFKK